MLPNNLLICGVFIYKILQDGFNMGFPHSPSPLVLSELKIENEGRKFSVFNELENRIQIDVLGAP